MQASDTPAEIGVLASGGLDSSILLARLLDLGRHVRPFYVRSGLCWQGAELAHLNRLLASLASPRLGKLVVLELPLADLYGDHWSVTGQGVPDQATDDDAVYLPGRNALLAIKAMLWCQMRGIGELALAPLASNPFADARSEFFSDFESALNRASEGCVKITRPFSHLSKQAVMEMGRHLRLDLTFSCIAPVDGLHCGHCNKCGERQAAFRQAFGDDPTRYAAAATRP